MSADLAIGSPRTQPAIGVPRPRPGAGPAAETLAAGELAPGELAPGALHLAPGALPRWRALLELHWRARLERVTELSLAYHDAEEASACPGRGSARTARQARPLLRQAVAERRALAEIEAALARLASGSFGRCERCGAVVPAARLNRIPQARYCAGCDR